MKTAVVFGAGNIGRGFIAQLFSESGYLVNFIDIDDSLITHFNTEKTYELQTAYNDDINNYTIGPVAGINGKDNQSVVDALSQADVAATAVGVRALDYLIDNFATTIIQRSQENKAPLNIIFCENLKNAAAIIRDKVKAKLSPEHHDYLESHIGFVDTVIGRMVPAPSADSPTGFIRVEPYKELPVDKDCFRGEIPSISNMTAYENFYLFTARKLYIHNCGHAILSYCGFLKDYEFGYEAMENDWVYDCLTAAWSESKEAIVATYQADADWLQQHIDDLSYRFKNKTLGDSIFRLGKDPIRKLGPTDRLISPYLMARKSGLEASALAKGIAAAFCFTPAEDPIALELLERLKNDVLQASLETISGIKADSMEEKQIESAYEKLKSGNLN